jgi:tRNA(Ile)-lysidine synthase
MARRKRSLEDLILEKLPGKSRIILAVSGGLDSVVMLSLFNQIKKKKLISDLYIAHINHQLRSESADDAIFVKKLAYNYKIKCKVLKLKKNKNYQVNIEDWARKERYAALEILRDKQGFDYVATAHNANDQIETFLFQLFSNRNLSGIAEIDEKRHLLRPLLRASRATLVEHALNNNLVWREDSTNIDTDFTRNMIRGVILPYLTDKFQQDVSDSLLRQLEELTELSDTIRKQASTIASGANEISSKLLKRKIKGLDRVLAWRVLEEIFIEKCQFRIGREAAINVLSVLRGTLKATTLPGGIVFKG